MKRITDPAFRYTPAAETTAEYLKRKFDRERKRIAEQKKKFEHNEAEAKAKTIVIDSIKKAARGVDR